MSLYVIDQLLQTISANLVIFHTVRSRLPLEIEETVVVWCLFPERIIAETKVIDPEAHYFLDNLVIISFSDNELQGSPVLILCCRNFRVFLFGLFSGLLNSFLFFYKFIIRINNFFGRRTEIWLLNQLSIITSFPTSIICVRILVYFIFFILFSNFFCFLRQHC
jgi:hypothetical protein